jgi:hypothetical protein
MSSCGVLLEYQQDTGNMSSCGVLLDYQQDTGNMSSCGVLLDYQQDTGDMSSSTYFMHSTDREILTRVLQTILRPLHFFLTMYKIYDAPFRANLKVSCHSDVWK